MAPETNAQRKLRLLRDFSDTNLPAYTRDEAPSNDLFAISDMIEEGWIEGYSLPHSSGSGFASLHVIRILDPGWNALAASKPLARTIELAKRIWTPTRSVIAGGVVLFTAFMAWLAWRHPSQSEPSATPPPPSTNPATPTQQTSARASTVTTKSLGLPPPTSSPSPTPKHP